MKIGINSSDEESEDEDSDNVITEDDDDTNMSDVDRLLDNKNEQQSGGDNNFDPFSNQENETTSATASESGSSNENTDETASASASVSATSEKRRPPTRQKTLDEINQEKQEMLYRLERFDLNGFKASRKFNMASNYDDIKFEYERIKKQRDTDKSIKFQRKILMAVCSGVEFLNGKFAPFDIKLDGWSDQVNENLTDYDDIFSELHDKYKSKASCCSCENCIS